MRGKVSILQIFSYKPRITPAYAGKSGLRVSDVLSLRDHPRLCGEKGIRG